MYRLSAALSVALIMAGCGAPAPAPENTSSVARSDGLIELTTEQIEAANITLVRPSRGTNGSIIEAPGLLESDADDTRIVAAPIAGRVVSLNRNLGDAVRRGDPLAIIESREVAGLQAEVEKARSRLSLVLATLRRDEALYVRGFRPLREVEISRAAADQARTDLRLAQQQVAASGVRGGSLNRIVITAPIAGRVISRTATLGQVFTADAAETELYRIAALDRLAVTMSLSPADAARVSPNTPVEITAGGRRSVARVRFVSPALDTQTRLVRVVADLDNRAGQWRAGEPVQTRVLDERPGSGGVMVPAIAIQTIDNRPVVFVRTAEGFRVLAVTIGNRDGAMVAITAGLSGDERVAAAGSFTLKAELGKSEAGED